MAPSVFAHELAQPVLVLQIRPGDFFGTNQTPALQLICHASDAANALNYGGEIVAARIGAFLEIFEIDARRIARVRRGELDLPSRLFVCAFNTANVRSSRLARMTSE